MLKPIFGFDVSQQINLFGLHRMAILIHGQNIVQMLNTMFSVLGPDTDMLRKVLLDIGEKQCKLGLSPDHFRLLCRALLEVLSNVMKDEWTAELKNAWFQVIRFLSFEISKVMQKRMLTQCNPVARQNTPSTATSASAASMKRVKSITAEKTQKPSFESLMKAKLRQVESHPQISANANWSQQQQSKNLVVRGNKILQSISPTQNFEWPQYPKNNLVKPPKPNRDIMLVVEEPSCEPVMVAVVPENHPTTTTEPSLKSVKSITSDTTKSLDNLIMAHLKQVRSLPQITANFDWLLHSKNTVKANKAAWQSKTHPMQTKNFEWPRSPKKNLVTRSLKTTNRDP